MEVIMNHVERFQYLPVFGGLKQMNTNDRRGIISSKSQSCLFMCGPRSRKYPGALYPARFRGLVSLQLIFCPIKLIRLIGFKKNFFQEY